MTWEGHVEAEAGWRRTGKHFCIQLPCMCEVQCYTIPIPLGRSLALLPARHHTPHSTPLAMRMRNTWRQARLDHGHRSLSCSAIETAHSRRGLLLSSLPLVAVPLAIQNAAAQASPQPAPQPPLTTEQPSIVTSVLSIPSSSPSCSPALPSRKNSVVSSPPPWCDNGGIRADVQLRVSPVTNDSKQQQVVLAFSPGFLISPSSYEYILTAASGVCGVHTCWVEA